MVKRSGRRRNALVLLMVAAVLMMAGGCAAGGSAGLSALVTAEGKGASPDAEQTVGGDLAGESGGYTAIYVPDDREGSELPGGEGAEAPTEETVPLGGGAGAIGEQPGGEGGEAGRGQDKPDDSNGTGEISPDSDVPGMDGEQAVDGDGDRGVATEPGKEVKRVALTFDDGPDLKYTTAILDILKEEDVKATFFVVGIQVEKYPDIVLRMIDEGHVVGNHTQGHKDLSKLSKAQMLKQIEEADQAIEEAIGVRVPLFRAPYGAVSELLKETLAEQGRRLVGWTVDTRDWAGTSIADMRDMIRKETKSDGIILMHSFGGKHIANTVEMLPDVIRDLRELGFAFVTVDDIPE